MKDHFGLVPSYIIQSVLAVLSKVFNEFRFYKRSTCHPIRECSILSDQMVKHWKKYGFPHHDFWFIRLWLIFYPLSSSIIILSPTVIIFWLGVIWFQANLERYAREKTELLGGSTCLKNISQIGSFPRNRGENKKCLKPPPSWKSSPTIRLLKAHHAATPHVFCFCWKQRLRRCAHKRCNLKQESRV